MIRAHSKQRGELRAGGDQASSVARLQASNTLLLVTGGMLSATQGQRRGGPCSFFCDAEQRHTEETLAAFFVASEGCMSYITSGYS